MLAIKSIALSKIGLLRLLPLIALLILPASSVRAQVADHTLTISLEKCSTNKPLGSTHLHHKEAHWEILDEGQNGGFSGLNIKQGETIKWVCTNYAFSLVVSNRQDWTNSSGHLRPVENPPNDEGIIDSSTIPGTSNVQEVVLQFLPAKPKSSPDPVDINYLIISGASSGHLSRDAKMKPISIFWFPKDMYQDMAVATMTWQ